MRVIKLAWDTDKKAILNQIDSTSAGIKIMQDKMEVELFYIQNLRTPAANILKQDALSIGAELAVEKNTILCLSKYTNALLIANKKQLKILSKKEKAQPFGLKNLANEITKYLNIPKYPTKIMGVINANHDSFYQGSRFSDRDAIVKIEGMIDDGADIIDIGAVSSRPGSVGVSEEEEFGRLESLIDAIYREKLYEKVKFSLDSYSVKSLRYALDHGFSIVNDITALSSNEVASLSAEYGASVVLMHMLDKPSTMQNNPSYDHVIADIDLFFQDRIEKAESFGIKDIILDVGIGFGKSLEHNLLLIKHLSHFKKFHKELLIGASRKSMIDQIVSSDISQRLSGTLAIHLKSLEEGANILRVHDVKEHYQAIKVKEALDRALI